MASIRALGPRDGPLLRRVRLAALADSPDAFGFTHAEEATIADAEWTARAGAADEAVFVALADGGEPLGMAGAQWHGEPPDAIGLWGMWVAPTQRGTGLGARLVDAVVEWAVAAGAPRVRLGVMDEARDVVAFYERQGFQRTGEQRRLRRDPNRTWHEMVRAL